uniref:Non-structural maintenance of chromosomes element 1 homolog n=1 Tax=Clastoptera arizonana TaxID=38151 RepID=A0A1B6CGY7_9HEMI
MHIVYSQYSQSQDKTQYVLEEVENIFSPLDHLMVLFCMRNKMIKKSDFVSKVEEIYDDPVDINTIIDTIKSNLRGINITIEEIICEITGVAYIVFANLASYKCLTKIPSMNENEILFYKMLVECIIHSTNGCIPMADILKHRPPNIKTDGQLPLDKFIADNKFKVVDGYLCFTPQTIAELKPIFFENYSNQILKCGICSGFVFTGIPCNDCKSKYHNHCFKKISRDSEECPNCGKLMNYVNIKLN